MSVGSTVSTLGVLVFVLGCTSAPTPTTCDADRTAGQNDSAVDSRGADQRAGPFDAGGARDDASANRFDLGIVPLGYLADGTAIYKDAVGIGTLYIPDLSKPHTIVYDTFTAQTIHPGCAGLAGLTQAETMECAAEGSLEYDVTYVQRLSPGTLSITLSSSSQSFASDHKAFKFAVSDRLIQNEEFQQSSIEGLPFACAKSSGYGVTIASYACDLVPQYVHFTATGWDAARCGDHDYLCRTQIVLQGSL